MYCCRLRQDVTTYPDAVHKHVSIICRANLSKMYLLTPCSRVLPEKLTGPQTVKKFLTFYGNRRFITAFTTARHLSLSWAILIQFMPPPPYFTSRRSILILSSLLRLGLPIDFRTSHFPIRPCMHLSSPSRPTTSAHLSFLYLITRIYLVRRTKHNASRCVVFSTLLSIHVHVILNVLYFPLAILLL
jgi:hypothetical protein